MYQFFHSAKRQKRGESFIYGSWGITTRNPSAVRQFLFTSGRLWAYPVSHETVGSVFNRCAAWVGGIDLSRRVEFFSKFRRHVE
jgi:hypothetical protein